MPKEPDELGLQQAELVIVLQKEEGEAPCVCVCAQTNINPDLNAQSCVLSFTLDIK